MCRKLQYTIWNDNAQRGNSWLTCCDHYNSRLPVLIIHLQEYISMTISKRYLNILETKRTYDTEWTFRVKGHSQLYNKN